jgi:hypothetical protein
LKIIGNFIWQFVFVNFLVISKFLVMKAEHTVASYMAEILQVKFQLDLNIMNMNILFPFFKPRIIKVKFKALIVTKWPTERPPARYQHQPYVVFL